jgi:hypothetical protein
VSAVRCQLDGKWLRLGVRLSAAPVAREPRALARLLDLGDALAALKLSLDGRNRLWIGCSWPAAQLSPALLVLLLREFDDVRALLLGVSGREGA